jgi:hypothetical protein
MVGLMENSGGFLIKIAHTSLSLSTSGLKLNADDFYFDIGTSGLLTNLLCTGIDTGAPEYFNSSKLRIDLDTENFNMND